MTTVKLLRKGSDYWVQKDNYVPFSNLSLCPKAVIALVQSKFEIEDLDELLVLKTPSGNKHYEHLRRMRQIADKQSIFGFEQETVQESDHSKWANDSYFY